MKSDAQMLRVTLLAIPRSASAPLVTWEEPAGNDAAARPHVDDSACHTF